MRTEFSRTWATTDGERVTRVTPTPQFFRNRDGKLEDFALDIERTGSGAATADLGDARVTLPEGSTGDNETTLRKGDFWISMKLRSSAEPTPAVSGRSATYVGVEPGVSRELETLPGGVKESLTLASRRAKRSFIYDVSMSAGLTLKMTSAGDIEVRSVAETVFRIPKGIAFERDNPRNGTSAAYQIGQDEDGSWTVRAEVPQAWAEANERQWPVVLDPTLTTNRLPPGYGSTLSETPELWSDAGWTGGADAGYHTAVFGKPTMPTSLRSAQIVSAVLHAYVGAVDVGTPETGGIATNLALSRDATANAPEVVLDSVEMSANSHAVFDLTPEVRAWNEWNKNPATGHEPTFLRLSRSPVEQPAFYDYIYSDSPWVSDMGYTGCSLREYAQGEDPWPCKDRLTKIATTSNPDPDKQPYLEITSAFPGAPLANGSVNVGGRSYRFGDANGDGTADAILVDPATGTISVAAGNGDGTFDAESTWGSFGAPVTDIAVGNMNGADALDGAEQSDSPNADARDDVIARTSSGTLAVRTSTGSAFATPTSKNLTDRQATWPATRSLNLRDVDGDQSADIWGMDASTRELWVGYSDGDGFQTAEVWSTIPAARDVTVSDLNGDGASDLVTYEPSDGVVRFHRSDGESFGNTETWGQGPTASDFTTGDIDGNGLMDSVFRAPDVGQAPGVVTGYKSSRGNGFISGSQDLGALAQVFSLQASDLTGDGLGDVVGTRAASGTLAIRSTESNVPATDEADITPVDPDPPGDSPSAARRATAQPGASAVLMMSDDAGLSYAQGLPGNRQADLLGQMKYLGATRVRMIAYWGQFDRLHPDDRPNLVLRRGQETKQVLTDPNEVPSDPSRVRRFLLPQDTAADRPIPTPTGGQPRDQALRNLLRENTEADLKPEFINGQWRIVEHRYYLKTLRDTLARIKDAGMTIHLTITGLAAYADCKGYAGADPAQATLQVRGCRNTSSQQNRTGINPDPSSYGHVVGELAQHLRSGYDDPDNPADPEVTGQNDWDVARPALGSSLYSVGIWNEPNFSTYLRTAVGPKERFKATDTLYGRLYQAAYSDLSARGLTSGLRVAMGELTPDIATFSGEKAKSKKHTLPPTTYLENAVAAAKLANGGQPVRAFALAVHPYQHDVAPTNPSPRTPFGVYGVGQPVGGNHSVKGTLSGLAPASLLKTSSTQGAAPEIWATEFGYYTSNVGVKTVGSRTLNTLADPKNRAKVHNERTRNLWMGGTNGALNRLVTKGGVKVIGLWEVLEDPPARIGLETLSPRSPLASDNLPLLDSPVGYGFIGTGEERSGAAGASYRAQSGTDALSLDYTQARNMFRLTGSRPYGITEGKRPSGRTSSPPAALDRWLSYQYPQERKVACTVKAIWAPDVAQTNTWNPPYAPNSPQKLPAC